MKKWLFIPFLFVATVLLAQEKEDVVYLEDGSILRGTIIHSPDSNVVKIEILGGSVFVVQKAEVKYIKKEPIKPTAMARSKRPITIKQSGFWGEFNLGFPAGTDVWSSPTVGVSLNTVLGYQFNPMLRVGLGSGIDHYTWNATYMPVFGRVSGDFFKLPITPIYLVDFGYGVNINSDNGVAEYAGGAMTNIGTGIKFNTPGFLNINLIMSYKIQSGSATFYNNWNGGDGYQQRYRYHRLEFKLALGF